MLVFCEDDCIFIVPTAKALKARNVLFGAFVLAYYLGASAHLKSLNSVNFTPMHMGIGT